MADTQQYRDMIAQYRAMAAASNAATELANGAGSYRQCTACTHRAGLHQYRLGPCKAHIMGEACGCLEFK